MSTKARDKKKAPRPTAADDQGASDKKDTALPPGNALATVLPVNVIAATGGK